MKFHLRDYRPQDFETLWSIDQQCFSPEVAYSRAELAAYIGHKWSFTLVAESAANDGNRSASGNPHEREGITAFAGRSRIAGFIIAASSHKGAGHIISIDVLHGSRRSGLGSTLLTAAEERLRSARCRSVFLETAVDNAAALAFYKRHSYHVINMIPRYYPSGVDAFVLEKEIASLSG